ncbi:MAG: hypothetical protein ACLUEK_05270 [Oscillospiraceae bacterium]
MNEINNKKKKNRFVHIAVAAALVLVCLGGYPDTATAPPPTPA